MTSAVSPFVLYAAAWMAALSGWALLLFGFDKWRAGRGGRRVPEATLLLACAVGGWPGGLAGMFLFRHKSAKTSFQLKFAAVVAAWVGAVVATALWLGWV